MTSDRKETSATNGLTRRQLLHSTGIATVALGSGVLGAGAVLATQPNADAQLIADAKPAAPASGGPYNIMFILTDQERYFDPADLPSGYILPGRERLKQRGVTFTNHQVNSMVCTSSRSVIYSGQHIQHTKLFDNMDVPWMDGVRLGVPTIGDLLGQAGYYAAYKGKWHMSQELGTHNEYALPQEKLTEIINSYGFNDYVGIGDVIGHEQGGYLNDEMIGAQAQRWLRLQGKPKSQKNEPWYLAVNIVNPHDVMFYNTDLPGQNVHNDGKSLMPVQREPDYDIYQQQWDVKLPRSRMEPFDKAGRPAAHHEYQKARAALVGDFPNEDGRWQRLNNYYLNCIQHTDRVISGVLDELDALGLADNTIIVLTSDHGELGGAHGTHGKGATAYREQNNVPLIVSHPGYKHTHGQQCHAVTSHLDLTPSMISWAGADTKGLPGKDLSALLDKGTTAGRNDLRAGSLYCYNMFLYLDSNLTSGVQAYLNTGGDPKKLPQQGFKPDMRKRGHIRSVFDGRYRFSRYFSPKQFNQPRTMEGILQYNDVELFDLDADPDEMNNLGIDTRKNGELMLAMNAKMNQLIEDEVGVADDGRFLPGENVNWAAATFDP